MNRRAAWGDGPEGAFRGRRLLEPFHIEADLIALEEAGVPPITRMRARFARTLGVRE